MSTVFQHGGNYLTWKSLNWVLTLFNQTQWLELPTNRAKSSWCPSRNLPESQDPFPLTELSLSPLQGTPQGRKLQFLICSSPPALTGLRNRCHWVSAGNKTLWATSWASGANAHTWKLTSCLQPFILHCFASAGRNGRASSLMQMARGILNVLTQRQ